ncbi:4488_t:CDS:2 [Paraglomus occultum]|uniref:4488_t:CDS:1 n=1 Tax=Paraglomus occultum TaxID=144539 RepID=A0A9N9B0G1_9GLOM|nr:4488_t:CDS:2 [Paraglomus occultum]
MNQIIKIIERKITEISKKSQAGREEYDEEQEKLLKSLFFDDGEIKKYLAAKKAKKSAATEALKTENEALKSEIGKINKENQELFDSNKKLDKNNKKFQAEITKLEGVLENYANPEAQATIKTVVSENATRVTQEKEQKKIKEELVAARQLLEANQTEKEIQEKKIEEYKEKLKELSEENISLQERIRVYEIFAGKEKLTTPSPASSQHNSLNVKPVEDLDDEIDDLKAKIKELKKPSQDKQTPSESDQNQKTTSQPSPQDPSLRRSDSSSSLLSAGRSRNRSGSRRNTGDTGNIRRPSLEKRLSPTITTITENPLVSSPTSENNGFSSPVSESSKDSVGDSHSTTENGKNITYTSNNDKLNKLEEEQQNDLQQEVPANFQSTTNEQQILQKERYELRSQIIDKLNKQLAEAEYNLSLAKTYLTESRADLATSQETAANLVIEKRKEMLKFSAEINRLKAKNVEVVGRFETAREKNIELSEKLKKEEERSSNFHDEVVKLKEKVAELEAELEIEFSIQNTIPQELAGEECKICPIKEAKITELKTSLEQANQD